MNIEDILSKKVCKFDISGILGLGRCFRRIDDNGDKSLDLEEFTKGLRDTGLEVSNEEAQEIFNQFDTDASGTINMNEFLLGIRVRLKQSIDRRFIIIPFQPFMSESRKKIVNQAFLKLDKTGDGVITQEDLK